MKYLSVLFVVSLLIGCGDQRLMAPPVPIDSSDPQITVLKSPAPMYPRRALMNGRSGWVVVEVAIAQDGRVVSATAIDSSDSATFSESAVESAKQWVIEPIENQGQYTFPIVKKFKIDFVPQ